MPLEVLVSLRKQLILPTRVFCLRRLDKGKSFLQVTQEQTRRKQRISKKDKAWTSPTRSLLKNFERFHHKERFTLGLVQRRGGGNPVE